MAATVIMDMYTAYIVYCLWLDTLTLFCLTLQVTSVRDFTKVTEVYAADWKQDSRKVVLDCWILLWKLLPRCIYFTWLLVFPDVFVLLWNDNTSWWWWYRCWWYLLPSLYIVLQVEAMVAVAEPFRACEPLINAAELVDKIVIVERGDCMFVDKVTYWFSTLWVVTCVRVLYYRIL